MKKNILMDVGFTIETTKDFEELTQVEILQALMLRVSSLMGHWEKDAIGFSDEIEVEARNPGFTEHLDCSDMDTANAGKRIDELEEINKKLVDRNRALATKVQDLKHASRSAVANLSRL